MNVSGLFSSYKNYIKVISQMLRQSKESITFFHSFPVSFPENISSATQTSAFATMVPGKLASKIQFSCQEKFGECEDREAMQDISREGTHPSALEVFVVRLGKKPRNDAMVGDFAQDRDCMKQSFEISYIPVFLQFYVTVFASANNYGSNK